MKFEGALIEGVPVGKLYAFAISEITGLAKGSQYKDECNGCNDCCFKPSAMVPALDNSKRYRLKPAGHPCWWLKWDEAFKCSIHATGEKPFTCFAYQCESRDKVVGNGSTV